MDKRDFRPTRRFLSQPCQRISLNKENLQEASDFNPHSHSVYKLNVHFFLNSIIFERA